MWALISLAKIIIEEWERLVVIGRRKDKVGRMGEKLMHLELAATRPRMKMRVSPESWQWFQ